jgi:plastocyanin
MTDQLVFDPDSLTIAPGDTVVFENVGNAGHSVTAYEDDIPEDADYWASGGFDSEQAASDAYDPTGSLDDTGNVAGGESWEHTFETEGTHEYFCIPHEAGGMVGEVVVTDDPGAVTPAPTATPGGTDTPMGNTTATEAPGGGGSVEVAVGPGGNFVFDPDSMTIPPGTTVTFSWKSDNHNVVPESQPEGANWAGEGEPGVTFDSGHSYSHTFDTTGTYEYVCTPHESAGMVGSITVEEGATLPGEGGEGGGGEGGGEVDPEEMGVPFQAHWVGIATLLGIGLTLLLTFFFLKYGETPHSGYPEDR